jgi:enterochelin esterase-like enzyme
VPCRTDNLPPVAVLDRIAATTNAQAAGDTLTFAVNAPNAKFVDIVGGLRTATLRVPGTDIWAVSVLVPDLEKARIGFQFITDTTRSYSTVHEFRGSAARAGPLRSSILHGTIRSDTLYSYALTATRQLITYVPPRTVQDKPLKVIYAADGTLVRSLAPAMDTLIAAGLMEPVVIVGVRAADTGDDRTREYVYGYDADSTRFLAHEKFFINEVSAWAESTLHVSSARQDRTIWGASNGGAFAVAMGLRHPDRFGRVIAMSPVYADIPAPNSATALPQFFLAAGTFEETTETRAGLLVNVLRGMHAPTKFEQFVGGHDAVVWVDTSVRDYISQ